MALPAKRFGAPALKTARRYSVNTPNTEAVRQSLYDIQAYAQAGQTSLNFFQVPQGQGTSAAVGSGPKILEDTNMEMAGSLPSPKSFLITSIEVIFFPAQDPSIIGADPQVADTGVNDAWKVFERGYLKLFIGSKDYLIEPLFRFPCKNYFDGFAAAAGTSTADKKMLSIASGHAAGQVYKLDPAILLVPTQNFSVTLNWGSVVAVSAAARIGVILDGILYRNSQ